MRRGGGVTEPERGTHTRHCEEGDRARAGQLESGTDRQKRREEPEQQLCSGGDGQALGHCREVSHPRVAGPGTCTEVVSV